MDIKESRNILVRGVDTVGTFVLATPFYRELQRNFPSAKITLCVKPLVGDLARRCPYVDEVMIYDKKEYGGEWGFIRELRRRNFETAFILSGSFHSALLCYLARIKNRIGYPHDSRGWLLTHKVDENIKLKKHCIEYLLDIIISVGGDVGKPSDSLPELWLEREVVEKGRDVLLKSSVDFSKKLIGVGFGVAGEKAREWPLSNWTELIESLISDGETSVVLFGTPSDRNDGESILSKIQENQSSVFNMCGKTSLIEFAGALKSLACYISVDTGGIHIASALGIPVVGLYVPGSDDRWGCRPSQGGRAVIISRKDAVNCAPCDQSQMKRCKNNRCMKAISVVEVLRAVKNLSV